MLIVKLWRLSCFGQIFQFLAATRSWNASCLHFYVLPRRLSFPNSFFSLCLSPHPSYRVSYSHLTSFRSSPFRTPARASMWSFKGVRLFRFQIRFSILMRWRKLVSWRRDSILRPSERMSWQVSKVCFWMDHLNNRSSIAPPMRAPPHWCAVGVECWIWDSEIVRHVVQWCAMVVCVGGRVDSKNGIKM